MVDNDNQGSFEAHEEEAFDKALIAPKASDTLVKNGKILHGSRVAVAKVGVVLP